MSRILFSTLLMALLCLSVFGQGRRGPMGDMFQGQTPPPGAITVLGRSFVGSMQNGFGNSLAMIIASDNQTIRQELGLSDAEVNTIQLVKTQMVLNTPKYAARFKNMTETDQKSIQEDLERDMGRITEHFNKSLSPERKTQVNKLVFQSLGGLDSPMTNLSSMEALNLSEGQKKNMQVVFDEMKAERTAQMEKGFELIEKAIKLGGRNMSAEDRENLDKERRELESQIFSTSKKLAERLRKQLTADQLEQEKQLIASRPGFLPPLPRQLRENTEGSGYRPGANSWRPGQEIPVELQDLKESRKFPRTEE